MSYKEYRDMFYKAQKNDAPYVMFTVDIINSKGMDALERCDAQEELIELHDYVYQSSFYFSIDMTTLFGTISMPQRRGDACAWWTTREHEEKLLQKIVHFLSDTHLKVRVAKAYFETEEYCYGDNKYYGGYCFDELTNAHKPDGVGDKYIVYRKVR